MQIVAAEQTPKDEAVESDKAAGTHKTTEASSGTEESVKEEIMEIGGGSKEESNVRIPNEMNSNATAKDDTTETTEKDDTTGTTERPPQPVASHIEAPHIDDSSTNLSNKGEQIQESKSDAKSSVLELRGRGGRIMRVKTAEETHTQAQKASAENADLQKENAEINHAILRASSVEQAELSANMSAEEQKQHDKDASLAESTNSIERNEIKATKATDQEISKPQPTPQLVEERVAQTGAEKRIYKLMTVREQVAQDIVQPKAMETGDKFEANVEIDDFAVEKQEEADVKEEVGSVPRDLQDTERHADRGRRQEENGEKHSEIKEDKEEREKVASEAKQVQSHESDPTKFKLSQDPITVAVNAEAADTNSEEIRKQVKKSKHAGKPDLAKEACHSTQKIGNERNSGKEVAARTEEESRDDIDKSTPVEQTVYSAQNDEKNPSHESGQQTDKKSGVAPTFKSHVYASTIDACPATLGRPHKLIPDDSYPEGWETCQMCLQICPSPDTTLCYCPATLGSAHQLDGDTCTRCFGFPDVVYDATPHYCETKINQMVKEMSVASQTGLIETHKSTESAGAAAPDKEAATATAVADPSCFAEEPSEVSLATVIAKEANKSGEQTERQDQTETAHHEKTGAVMEGWPEKTTQSRTKFTSFVHDTTYDVCPATMGAQHSPVSAEPVDGRPQFARTHFNCTSTRAGLSQSYSSM